MELYLAVDVQGGRVVRLRQGEARRATAYADDPVAVARQFARDGARWVHFVDLDRAFGNGDNRELARRFLTAVAVPVQVGGGLRTEEAIEEMLGWGATRVVIGTKAATDPALVERLLARHGPEQLAVGIDAKDGQVAVRGWTEVFELTALQLAQPAISFHFDRAASGKWTLISRASLLERSTLTSQRSTFKSNGRTGQRASEQ